MNTVTKKQNTGCFCEKLWNTQNTLSCPCTNQSVSVPRIECAVVVIIALKSKIEGPEGYTKKTKRQRGFYVSLDLKISK